MKRKSNSHDYNRGGVAEAIDAPLATIADVAGQKLDEARERLSDGLESAQQEANKMMRSSPVRAIAIAVGIGALIGFILARQSARN
jgi:ElaB/YqjD/DUF883 family membrane-anchored ribosome-binding protein